ncbi:MAG: adenosylcobinamide-GDP ribazoletransferase [Candidatus Bathyarchaeota archaeon]|nr:adenosylcobinamide-GDP ribazoletransferase [Candidatus Bathyarchaeota archaeon]
MIKELKNILSFLTAIPIKMDKDILSDCAKGMFLFPLIGAFIGLIAGVFGWVAFQFLPNLVAGVLVLGLLLIITGLHHTDGLLDFGDGIMAHGSPERKIEIMHDQLTGAGGLSLGIMTFLVTALSFSELNPSIIIQSVIVVEISAKLSMVLGAWAGKSVHKGMNTTFLEAMHGKKGAIRLIAALIISFGIAIPLLRLTGIATVVAAILTSILIVYLSHKHFKGVTGDVLGATNELSRMTSIIVLLAMIRWV